MYNNQMYSFPSQVSPIKQNGTNELKVYGEGKLQLSPDHAIITLGVINENSDLTVAQNENNQKMTNVIQALREIGIPDNDMKTVIYQIDMMYDYENNKQILRGYKVNHQLQVSVESIGQTGLVIDTAVQSGANTVSNVTFTVKQVDDYYNQALVMAMNYAYEKAVAMANSLGATLNPLPKQIEELSAQASPPQPFLMAQAAQTPVQPGQIEITARIAVDYLY
ncbi:SIMPL domain-containing protein [Bacillus sp. FJAT-45350]|uniref:SIMPL domain-containing protein n=1 Tax=Bacillus sp. FJAT-45350 TaxID=2011014 RepID=UPI000BB76D2B|nr:SIMPL domain-containing protein [Bacillus sp. FJAT-45350]